MIGTAVRQADGVPDSIKHLFGELIAWNEAIVERTKDLDDRLEQSEAAIDEILEGAGEMISPQTAATLLASMEHGKRLCEAMSAIIEGALAATMDEMSKKRCAQLIEIAQKSFVLSSQVIAELTATDEDDEDDDQDEDDQDEAADGVDEENADGDDGDGDGIGADDDLDGDEAVDDEEDGDE